MSQDSGPASASRSRRARKKVDYSLEQQFSDEDIFEDEPKEEVRKKTGRPRKSNVGSSGGGGGGGSYYQGGGFAGDAGLSFERTKPIYTERGYDSSQLPLRERFTFEPEYEDDGTPTIEAIVGRRPIDDTKDRNAGASSSAADGEADHSSDQDESSDDDGDSDAPRRTRSKPKKLLKSTSMDEDDQDGGDGGGKSEMDYEYLIKYKGRSYLHLEWKTAADLESMNTKAKTIYRRFLKKLEAGTEEDLEDPTVDPAFTEPGRILAEEEHEIMVELSDKELVKWEKEQKKMEENDESEDEEDEEKDEEEKKEDDKMDVDEKAKDGEAKEEEDVGKRSFSSFCALHLDECLSNANFIGFTFRNRRAGNDDVRGTPPHCQQRRTLLPLAPWLGQSLPRRVLHRAPPQAPPVLPLLPGDIPLLLPKAPPEGVASANHDHARRLVEEADAGAAGAVHTDSERRGNAV